MQHKGDSDGMGDEVVEFVVEGLWLAIEPFEDDFVGEEEGDER